MSQQSSSEPRPSVAGRRPRASRSTGASSSPRRAAARAGTQAGTEVVSTAAGQGAEVASSAAGEGRAVAATTAKQGQAVATLAADDARQLAGAAKEQASGVVAEASEAMAEVLEQGRELLGTAKTELEEQLQAQTTRLAEGLARFGDEAQRLAAGRGYAEQAVAKLNDAADALFDVADDVASRGLEGLASDLGSFARRRPGAFLVGAAAVGFGVGRVVRGSLTDDDAEDEEAEEAPVAPATSARRRVAAGGVQ